MMWIYRGKELTEEDVAGYLGFVYIITNLETGRAYFGQKKLVFKRTRAPLKGKKRKRRDIVPSDWMEYWGSNLELQGDVEKLGVDSFQREVLHLCKSKAMMNYLEMREIIMSDALRLPKSYYNEYVGGRISRGQLKVK